LLAASALATTAWAHDHAAASAPAPTGNDGFGVLVMAHGGQPAWNQAVTEALAPVDRDYPTEIAFGMADAASLQAGVDRLQARGVGRIAVVRLFISGDSWYQRTAQMLGLQPGAPARPQPAVHAGHGEHAGHGMAFWRLQTDARFAMSRPGLAAAEGIGAVLAERARALSKTPAAEDVLILAHGPGDDAENQRWLQMMSARADAVRHALPFRRVEVATLREDWPDKRAAAEAQVRAFVQRANAEGGQAIVIPFRVQGFGPYAKVLDGLTYVSDGQGLVPSVQVTQWVREQARMLQRDLPRDAPAEGTPRH
jgi:sirohydrochlorin ferrochelatase